MTVSEYIKNIFRRRILRKLDGKVETGIIPVSQAVFGQNFVKKVKKSEKKSHFFT